MTISTDGPSENSIRVQYSLVQYCEIKQGWRKHNCTSYILRETRGVGQIGLKLGF